MKTAYPKSLKTGEKVCFKSVDTAIYSSDGRTVADHISDLKKNVATNTTNIDVERARIDNLIAESTEDTVSNAELIDIRTGQDSIVYTSAGEAVRGQFLNVYNAIKEITKYTRNAAPIEINLYDVINTNDTKTVIYTDYARFSNITSVSVPDGYKVKVTLYSYVSSTYTEISNSGWVDGYPIPKDTPIVISVKHLDDSIITKTEIVALTFAENYPDTIKNAVLDKVGFYETLQYKTYDSNGFSTTHISTDAFMTLDNLVFIKSKSSAYKCKVIRYSDNGNGTYSIVYDYGWNDEHYIPCQSPFLVSFYKVNGEPLYFDEFVENFIVEQVQLDDPYLNNLINTITGIGIINISADGVYTYGQSTGRLLSPLVTYNHPITLYIDDINSTSRIAYHILDEDDETRIVYDSQWSTSLTIPAKLPVKVYFKDDNNPVNIKNMYNIKVRDSANIGTNDFIKDIAHRGLSKYAPENTLLAFKYAKLQGFKYVECDVRFTSDNVAVIIHDTTIDRTARDSSGNVVSGKVADLTFNTLRTYDFGYWFAKQPTNIKIPSFEEFIIFCKKNGLHPYIHMDIDTTVSGNIANLQSLVDIVKLYGMLRNVTWISFNDVNLNIIKGKDSYARLGFLPGGSVTSTSITQVNNLKSGHNGEVFMDASTYAASDVELCRNASIPLEVWTIDDVNTILSLNMYISGVTSNYLQAGKLLLQDDDVESETV